MAPEPDDRDPARTGSRRCSVVLRMPVFLLPSLIQRLGPTSPGYPTIESHTRWHAGVGRSRWSSWFTRKDRPSPLQAAPVAVGERDSSHRTLQDDVPPSGFGREGTPGKHAHHPAGHLEFQREHHTECTSGSEPFNGGPASVAPRQSLIAPSSCVTRAQRHDHADSPRTGAEREKETA